ncbi:hypothetical protein IJG14_01540 [bacterium]|nr:hypothetical protein [bacterium]
MKNLINIKIALILLGLSIAQFSEASDLNLDFIRNQAFENRLYKPPVEREINLFSKNSNKNNSKDVEVEHINYKEDVNKINLTDEDYVKRYKQANKKRIRKKQFDITIEKNDVKKSDKQSKAKIIKKSNDTGNIKSNNIEQSEKIQTKNIEEKNYITDEKNQLVDEIDNVEDNSDKNFDPSNKTFFSKKKKNDTKQKTTAVKSSNMILTSDITDYYPERNEIEAIGNAKLEITGQDFELYGDKIIFNHDTNNVRAYDNVKIIQGENVTTGDFINIDMNTAHGWVQKPVSSNYSIRVKANEAYVFPDKIEEYDGVANIMEDKRIKIRSSSYTSFLTAIPSNLGDSYLKKPEPTAMKFKVKNIDVKSEEGHNIITMHNIGVYYKNFKIGVLPQLKIVADKEQTVMQTNIPEIGSDSNMGMYAGPSFVLNTPYSSTLRISPLIVYSQDEKKLGIGGTATFMSGSNVTEVGYGSPEDKFMLRGYQAITPKLKVNYSQNMYISQWFLGYRRPMYSAEIEYGDSVYIKDLGVRFAHRLIGGVYSDYARISKLAEGRLRWMTQIHKNFFTYTNRANTFSLDLGLIGQGSISQYTTGDTLGIARFGPTLTTTYRGWSQRLMYFQSGASGRTPFRFDDYYYGKSNLQLLETLRINKYISVGYLASMALGGRETYSRGRYNPSTKNFLQENMFLVSVGPEEAKVTFTYDAFRQQTAVYFSMLLGTKDMDIAFKKTTINDPDTLNGENQKIPVIKDTFNKIRYKVFPSTNPAFVKSRDLYPKENLNTENENNDELDEMLEEQEKREIQQQLQNQLSPFLQNQELMKDNRM